jgi:DNA-directed RNA polymerase specialized sigma24 family protein
MQTTARSPIAKLLTLHYLSLFRFANRLCGSPERAMELTQRTFRLVLDRSRSLPVPANVRAWLLSVLFHEFLEARPTSSSRE